MTHSVGLWLVGIAVAVVLVIGISAVMLAVMPWRMKFERTTEPVRDRFTRARGIWVAICAVLVAAGGVYLGTNTSRSVTHADRVLASHLLSSDIKFTNPQTTGQNPVPVVPCQMEVQGTGRLAADEALAIGSVVAGGSIETFQSDISWLSKTTWQAHIYFGVSSDANKPFSLDAMVLPAPWVSYLIGESIFDTSQTTFWEAPGLPPPPARREAHETVRRSAAKTGC